MTGIFDDVVNFVGNTLKQIATGDSLKDYKHASRLFVSDQYKLMPKFGFLYHVFFDINPGAYPDPNNPNKNYELGMLVKTASLPKFTIDTKTLNAYNRPNIVQTKIHYDDLQINFHDDSADLVRNFWFDYYNYYYRDSDHSESLYHQEHKYQDVRPTSSWGYTPRKTDGVPYLNSIRIYSLHQKKFSEYVLINPIIKSFRHGEHVSGPGETMQHEMTISYESVLYCYGTVNSNTVKGFAQLHYDTSPSPLTPAGGGTRSILGAGGLLETGNDIIENLAEGNYGAAAFLAARGINNLSHMDLKSAATSELLGLGTSILRGNDPSSSIFVPSIPGLSNNLGAIGSRIGGSYDGLGGGGGGGTTGLLAGAGILGASALAGKILPQNDEVTQASATMYGAPQSSTSFLDPAQQAGARAAVTGSDPAESNMNSAFLDPSQRAQAAANSVEGTTSFLDPAQRAQNA